MECTIGVVTKNRPDCIRTLFASLRNQTRQPDEIIVVDDSENDATKEVVETQRQELECSVIYERGSSRSAQPGSRNTVIDRASGEIICFVDDDVYCEPMWLEIVHETFATREDVAAVGGPALLTDDTLEPRYEWYISTKTNQNSINGYAEDVELAEFWIPPKPVETDFLLGANMCFRTEALDAVGGFDTDYRYGPAYYEETDVMSKLNRRDETLLYHPDAMVCHVQSIDGGSRDEVTFDDRRSSLWFDHNHINKYWFCHNHVIFAYKNSISFPLSLLRLVISTEYRPAPLWRHVLTGVRRRDLDSTKQILKGYLDGLRAVWRLS